MTTGDTVPKQERRAPENRGSAAGPGEHGGASDRSEAVAVATAVLTVDHVVAMSAGPIGQFRSYLPGGRSVPGVRLDEETVQVNVVCQLAPGLDRIGEHVAEALGDLRRGRAVTACIDDVVLPGESQPAPPIVEDDAADPTVEQQDAR